MLAFARKSLSSLILKHTSSFACRSPISSSLSLSTSAETLHGISPAVSDILVHKYEFPPELASRVASEVSHLQNPERVNSILSFLKGIGCSNNQLKKIVKRRPLFLAASLECSIKPKIKILQDWGFSSDDICKMISSNPPILGANVNNKIIPSLSVLKGLLGSDIEAIRLVRRAPRLLTANMKNNVLPTVEFLKSCGIGMKRILSVLNGYPNSFLVQPVVFRKSAERAREMGLDVSHKSFVYAIRALAAMSSETWKLKLQAFRELGISDSDILTMFRNDPSCFSVSMEKIKKIIELLLGTGKFGISSIVLHPRSLKYSIEKRHIPRLRMLGILESRSLIDEWPGLGTLCPMSDDKFFDIYIRPHLKEIGDVYVIKSSALGDIKMKA